MQLTQKEYDAIKLECNYYENNRAAVIEALKIVQRNRGWVSESAIESIAEILMIPVVDVEGIATFYNQIFRQPVGKHIIRYCDSVVCYIKGCEIVQKFLENTLSINIGDTTMDKKFTLLPTCCLGICNLAPVIMIDTDLYTNIASDKIIEILGLY